MNSFFNWIVDHVDSIPQRRYCRIQTLLRKVQLHTFLAFDLLFVIFNFGLQISQEFIHFHQLLSCVFRLEFLNLNLFFQLIANVNLILSQNMVIQR